MVYILMGIAGSGKTTIGRLLAAALNLDFFDADDYHSRKKIAMMARGIPLNDEDRQPWLTRMAKAIPRWNSAGGAVLACSALKESYRRRLSGAAIDASCFIYLKGERRLLAERLARRDGHFFPAELLESQWQTLEEPTDAITADIDASPEVICSRILRLLAANRPHPIGRSHDPL